MSVEVALFILRVLAGIGLLAFLLALYLILWRSLRQAEPSRQSHGHLTATGGDGSSESASRFRIELSPIMTLGRSASNTIVVDDEFASAEHARIELREGRWWLEDCGSRNGTALNSEPVKSRALLADGDIIGIGRSRYVISLDN